MRTLLLILAVLIQINYINAQNYKEIEINIQNLHTSEEDTSKVWIFHKLSLNYIYSNPDSSFFYAKSGLELAEHLNYKRGISRCLNDIGNVYWITGNFILALELYHSALEISEIIEDQEMLAICNNNIGNIYFDQGEFIKAIEYYKKARLFDLNINNSSHLILVNRNIGESYLNLENKLDSALIFQNQALEMAFKTDDEVHIGRVLSNLGNINFRMGNFDLARAYCHKSISYFKSISDYHSLNYVYLLLTDIFNQIENYDSSFFYVNKAYDVAFKGDFSLGILKSSTMLSKEYMGLNKDSTIKYLEISSKAKDSLFSQERVRQLQLMHFDEEFRQKEIATQKRIEVERRKINIQYYSIFIGLIIIFSIFIFLSKSIIVEAKVIEISSVIFLLISFEFLNILLDPFIEIYSFRSPLIRLSFMVILASIIAPVHNYLKKIFVYKLLQTNKSIALKNGTIELKRK